VKTLGSKIIVETSTVKHFSLSLGNVQKGCPIFLRFLEIPMMSYKLCTIYLFLYTISNFSCYAYLPKTRKSFKDVPLQIIFNEIDLTFLL
jgi:hypothetical protein